MTADGPQTSPTPEKVWYQQWWVWAIAAVAVLAVVAFVVMGSGGGDEAAETTIAEASTTVPETTTAPETTTTSVEETTTTVPEETTTSAPEETTTTVPEETTTTLPAVLAAGEGSGNAIIELDIPPVPAVVDMTHDGAGVFSVESLDQDLESIAYLAITSGPHEGTGGIQLSDTEVVGGLEIEADGNWTYEIRPVSGEPELTCPVEGRAENVIVLAAFKDAGGQAHVTYDGDQPFSITAYGNDESDLILNEIGPYDGTDPERDRSLRRHDRRSRRHVRLAHRRHVRQRTLVDRLLIGSGPGRNEIETGRGRPASHEEDPPALRASPPHPAAGPGRTCDARSTELPPLPSGHLPHIRGGEKTARLSPRTPSSPPLQRGRRGGAPATTQRGARTGG